MAPRINSFEEFWPYYVRAHQKPSNRALHVVGTTLGLSTAAAALVTGRLSLLLAAPVVGYLPAWIGHFVLEGNVPATFGHPLWSLKGDFVMLSKILQGKMADEVARAVAEVETTEVAGEPATDSEPTTAPLPPKMPRINVSPEPSGAVN